MTIKEIRAATGLTQAAFGDMLGIPKRTIENWESGVSAPAPYLLPMLNARLRELGFELSSYSPEKMDPQE